eukprot:GILK01012636.1.p1 GENE.GILK01012636.1~~GILK01012636.1.p1  ORF type:complete len:122 (+),score=17.37 GILK01012636.1:45-410(+)
MATSRFLSVKFEVFGRVQGVFFRKYTQQQAVQLGLVGYCLNTPTGSVKGVIQGPPPKCHEMRHWLTEVGSPKSKIERLDILEETDVPELEFDSFMVLEEEPRPGVPLKKKSAFLAKAKKIR